MENVFLGSTSCPLLKLVFALHLVCLRKMKEVTQANSKYWDKQWQIINNSYNLFLSIESTSSQPPIFQYSK